ncbi:TonB-dependent receptor domain-containing protein [Oleiharenicola lentus]|uniref:TonB-dependent receptor domain-containing protein n=1 Tax=Oleiharenicola lentus TaxID=2508720 RepID=UPI003F66358D
MNARSQWKRLTLLALLTATGAIPAAVAQTATASTTSPAPNEDPVKLEKFVVTGSLIKRAADEGALPLSVFTKFEMEQEGIASAEQLIMNLNINGNGFDNLATNTDVVGGEGPRGNNGASSANLRGQGANATLILLNGRRIASHGLNGGVVDLNSIPFAAIERVEVLKDGASATYGTDAVGGVINFITKRDFQGLIANAATDITEDGGGNISRYSLVGGWGDLNKDKWNLMASVSLADHKKLNGDQRDFVNTFQPKRGISPDTRGTPIATLQTIANLPTALGLSTANPIDPANPAIRVNQINILDLPTNTAGYTGFDGMGPYEELLWAATSATGNGKYGSAWDTGRAAVLQQPVKNTNFVSRGSLKLGEHILTLEAIVGRSESTKSFSPNQWSTAGLTATGAQTTTTSANGTVIPNPQSGMVYPSTGADYNRVFNALVAYFPALEANRGLPLGFRWRALPGGNREIATQSDTRRFLVGMEGPLPIPIDFFSEWEYRTGVSQSESKSKSKLLNGYYYTLPFANLIKTGVLSPFSYEQSQTAIDGLKAASATGVELYGGTFTTTGADFTTSGPLFKLPAGQIQAAAGFDYRKEEYSFVGDTRTDLSTVESHIFGAPFDNLLATGGTLSRDIYAFFAEVEIPVIKNLDLNVAARRDDYTGFGSSTNPKVTLRYAPIEQVLLRSSYSTGFRVPTFKQQFDPAVESIFAGADLIDPATGLSIPANSLNIISGGKPDLQPEEAEMKSVGIVLSPVKNITFGVDWWSIERTGTIQSLGASVILANSSLFEDRIIRGAGGTGPITKIDVRPLNAGETQTKGVEYTGRGEFDLFGGKIIGDVNVSQLLEKKSRLIASAPFGRSEVGRFTRYSDIGIKWKSTASVSYRKGKWTGRLSQLYRCGYLDYVPPGIANGTFLPFAPDYNPKVGEYITYNASLTYRLNKDLTIVAGIKNLLNEDPPFSIAYDTNTGAGSSWEPRVADPRGRSFTLSVEYKFF